MISSRILLVWIVAALWCPPFLPARETWTHERHTLGAWTVQVDARLLSQRPKLAARALSLLEEKLGEADQFLPADKLAFLRERPIWLSLDNGKGTVYHPSAKWLSEHDKNPAMAGCIEISNVDNFISWSGHQPMMIVHELAHAFHHRRHDFGHAALRRHFRVVKEAGIYDQVAYWNGHVRPAYALNNHKEYFAELTEAYLGRNEIFPFIREELRRHDPEGCTLIKQIWNQPLGARSGRGPVAAKPPILPGS